jgi:hypothetical protein
MINRTKTYEQSDANMKSSYAVYRLFSISVSLLSLPALGFLKRKQSILPLPNKY